MKTVPAKTYTPRDIEALGSSLGLWLRISVAAGTLHMVLAAVDLTLLLGMPMQTSLGPYGDFPGHEIPMTVTAVARLPVLAVMIVTGFLFLKWIYRASRNAHAWAGPLRTSPPWAVGWFFVPVAFLWVPFTAFSETWRVSHDPEDWKRANVPPLLRWWWGFWLAESLIGQGSTRSALNASTTGAIAVVTAFELVSAGFGVLGCIAAIRIVDRLTEIQTRRLRQDVF